MTRKNNRRTWDEMEQEAAAYAKHVPDRLLDIDARAGQAWSGFFDLGFYDGATDEFERGFVNRLHEAGWPVFKRDEKGWWQRDEGTKSGVKPNEALSDLLKSLTDPADRVTLGGRGLSARKHRRNSLAFKLSYESDFQEARDFILKDENLAALEKAVEDSIAEVRAKYGDPFAVKRGQRSSLKAIFDALADHRTFGFLSHFRSAAEQQTAAAENKLVRVMNDVRARMEKHRVAEGDAQVPVIEFHGRLQEKLEEKGWPLSDKKPGQRLSEMLANFENAAQVKTTLILRLELQDNTSPPRPWERAAKDYILAHADDVAEAAAAVDRELSREILTPGGLQPRHFQWAGGKRGASMTDAVAGILNEVLKDDKKPPSP